MKPTLSDRVFDIFGSILAIITAIIVFNLLEKAISLLFKGHL